MTLDTSSSKIQRIELEQALSTALSQHQAGDLQEAEKCYLSILKVEPSHPEANHNLGVLYVQMKQPASGLSYLITALNAEPARGQFWLSYIDALFKSDQIDAAREILELARQHGLSGDNVDAMKVRLSVGIESVNQHNILTQQELTQSQSVSSKCAQTIENGHDHKTDRNGPLPYCPVCRSNKVAFLPLPAFYLDSARIHGFAHLGKGEMISLEQYTCNCCGASDRERIYALWVDQQLEKNTLSRLSKVMHFAPEVALSKRLRELFADYQTADFGMSHVDCRVDIQKLPFADESYDFFICSHVLEHVESDDQAISELYRITKAGGCGILVAPIAVGLEKTVEDPSVKDAAGRWRLYGQDDHLRLYAHDDYVNKIRSHGFRVAELGEEHFGADVFRSLGLIPSSILYVVSK